MEYSILGVLQKGLPQGRTPYEDMARQIGIETGELLRVLRDWKKQGKLRRMGAVVNHFRIGLSAAAMVAWQAEHERVVEIGKVFTGFKEVSHVYQRRSRRDWPYNIYTMVHGRNPEDVQSVVKLMTRAGGVSNYLILATEKELKKVPPTYITFNRVSK